MRGIVLQPETRWECPSCGLQDMTHEARPHSRMHSCSSLGGLTTPMARLKPGQVSLNRNEVVHELIEREDFIGEERGVQEVDGMAVMSVHTKRKDGSHDTTVYAPVATGRS